MNKEQAAKRLRVSVRTLQRYMSAHRIGFTTRKTKTGEEAVFAQDEVARFKKELQGQRLTATVTPSVMAVSEAGIPQEQGPEVTALALIREAPPAFFQAAPNLFWKRLADRLTPTTEKPTASLSEKLLLSIPEAAALSGIPASKLRSAVNSGELRAVSGVGRGLGKVRRETLTAYVKSLEKNRTRRVG
jgi:hypothetical protein